MKLSRILVLLFAISLLQSVLSLAEGYPCAGILLKTSNVRKEASQKSDKLGEFKNGETVTVIGEQTSGGTTWYQVEFRNRTGYVRSDLIQIIQQGNTNVVAVNNTSTTILSNTSDQITFRGLTWYITKAEAEKVLLSEGGRIAGFSLSDNDIFRMSATDYANIRFGSDVVENGGYKGWYSGLSVAGYNPSDTYVCYLYPIQNGKVIHDEEQTQLYFGWYTFDSRDFVDHEGIYNDLKNKITTLYGKGKQGKDTYHTTLTWKDRSGNQIRLLINDDETYVTLGYMAAHAEEKLDALEKALDKEKAASEQTARTNNTNNTSGL